MEWYLLAALMLSFLALVLLAIEFFLPTGGVSVVFALAILAGAVVLVFLYGSLWEGLLTILAVSIALPVAGRFLFQGYKQLALDPKLAQSPAAEAVAGELGLPRLQDLVDAYGKTLSPMRPAGIVEIDGRRIDAMTEGRMLDVGVPVRCVGLRGTTILVRPVDPGTIQPAPRPPVDFQDDPEPV
jgi:membrane-bound serine protease (ClpP class)